MNLSIEFWLQIIVYILTLGVGAGAILTRLKYIELNQAKLEKKQDKYNNMQERMALVEQSARSAHHRLDNVEAKEAKDD